jgi:hypothetical protein
MSKTIIIHGWSDCSKSFESMKNRLIRRGVGTVDDILFLRYESREDSLTFDDVADGLHSRLQQRGIIAQDGSSREDFNFVVHSTGGLVVRHWLARHYGKNVGPCPVKRIVMLAPANFGSPLAHRGKSFFGSLVKGRWQVGDFLEVGQQLLDALELASPFQFSLAEDDILAGASPLCGNAMELTVLVGGSDYQGLRGWINKPGTDGTVVVSGTGIGITKLQVDYTRSTEATQIDYSSPAEQYAFGVLPDHNHGSIVSCFESPDSDVEKLVVSALCTPNREAFRDHIKRAGIGRLPAGKGPYQQFVFRAKDHEGNPVDDYTMEFFMVRKSKWWRNGKLAPKVNEYSDALEKEFSERVSRLLTAEAHTHTKDHSMRRVLVDCPAMDQLYDDVAQQWGQDYVLGGRIHIPETTKGAAYDTSELQDVAIISPDENGVGPEELIAENRTFLVDLRVRRYSKYVTLGTEALRGVEASRTAAM